MQKHWCYFFFMLWFSYLVISSILLFSRGFLLSKTSQTSNSTCLTVPEIPCLDRNQAHNHNAVEDDCSGNDKLLGILKNFNNASGICLPQKARVVIILVDALRYDFAKFNHNTIAPLPFQNKLPLIDQLLKDHPKSTRLYKFIADPPTTTAQRITALTTGGLPTFIEAGSNFASSEIIEDNIIDQLLRHEKSAVMMGDDTWESLYPNRFLRYYPYPSFDVWDLDTVDRGVNRHLFDELKRDDWSLLIAHYLGVDHCGHRYGPYHSEMERKLTEINSAIGKVINEMTDDTILFVIGDHGMTGTGDHGGETEDEVTSTLFVHSPTKELNLYNPTSDSVRQVGIVPTISTILGIPIPFSNIGTLILDAVPRTTDNWRMNLFHLWGNVKQVFNFIEDYSAFSPSTFSQAKLAQIRTNFDELNAKINFVDDELTFRDFSGRCTNFLEDLRHTCEEVWVQFDSYSISRGLVILILSLGFVYVITDGIPAKHLREIAIGSFVLCSYCAVLIAAAISGLLYYFNFVGNLLSAVFFSTGLISQFTLVMLVIQNWELISLNWYDRRLRDKIPNLVCRIVLVFHLLGLFSNSFVIEEATVLLFFLNTIILIGSLSVGVTSMTTAQPQQHKRRDIKSGLKVLAIALGILVLVRTSVFFWKCRDPNEQPWCHSQSSKAPTTKLQYILTVILLGCFVTATKNWLGSCGNLNGYSATVTVLRYCPTVLAVCTSGFWVLDRIDARHRNWQQPSFLAWFVYALTMGGLVALAARPLCVHVLPKRKDAAVVADRGDVIPQLFRKVKKLFEREAGGDDVPIVCGLATVYSAAFLAVGAFLTHLFALLAGDGVAPSVVIMFLVSCFVLIVASIIRLEKANTIEDLLEVPNMLVLIWVILSQYFFYGTGHQPTFANITWEAAFVGTTGVFSRNFIRATLVVLNTFSSHIFMGFMLPLLVIAPFTLSVMLPSVVKPSLSLNDNLRGEILLYERDGLMNTVVFTTSCKYILCHGIRVFATMLSATIHCRHLMVWTIFAPKFIFEALGIFVSVAVVNLGYLFLIRVNCKVDQLIVHLNKRYS